MARKLAVMLIVIILITMSIIKVPMVKAAGGEKLNPDIVTDKIIFLSSDPQLISTLKNGTLGIVSFNYQNYLGFDIPGGNLGTDLIVNLDKPISISITNPVALIFRNGKLEIYLAKDVKIISLPWNYLSLPEIKQTWFPYYISAQIVKLVDTGTWEKEVDYCYNPPVVKTNYYYKLHLTTDTNPYYLKKDAIPDIEIGIFIPDYLVETLKQLAENHEFVFVGINNNNIYIWTH
jgi:hypothetical protein